MNIRFVAILFVILATYLSGQTRADLLVNSWNIWTGSQASIGDDVHADYDTGPLQTGSIGSGSVVQFGNWPAPGSAQAFGSVQMDLTVSSSAIFVSGNTVSENLQSGGPPEIYSQGVAHLEFEFQVLDPTVLIEYSLQTTPWTFAELIYVNTQAVINPGSNVLLDAGLYSFTLEQFEFMQGGHSDPQSAEGFSLVLVENGNLSIIPEPAALLLVVGLTVLLIARFRHRRPGPVPAIHGI